MGVGVFVGVCNGDKCAWGDGGLVVDGDFFECECLVVFVVVAGLDVGNDSLDTGCCSA